MSIATFTKQYTHTPLFELVSKEQAMGLDDSLAIDLLRQMALSMMSTSDVDKMDFKQILAEAHNG